MKNMKIPAVLCAMALAASAAFFGCDKSTDSGDDGKVCPAPPETADANNDIRIISPNGGEVFHVGERIVVNVTGQNSVSALVLVYIGGQKMYTASSPLGINLSGNGATDTVSFEVPSIFEHSADGTSAISAVSDSVLIKISNYANPQYLDYSDCYFSIQP